MIKFRLLETLIGIIVGLIISGIKYQNNNDYTHSSVQPVITDEYENTESAEIETSVNNIEINNILDTYDFIPLERGLQVSIKDLCIKYDFDYDILLAIIRTESNFQENIVSSDGHDFGLCQVRDTYWDSIAQENNLYNWKTVSYENVELALIILTQCKLLADNNIENMLKYYNLGCIKDFIMYEDGTTYYTRFIDNYNWVLANK